jgi:dipeptidyl aminopeptidase/acylaminoacyl peptidase
VALVVVAAVIGVLVAVAATGHAFAIEERRVRIETAAGVLDAVLATPPGAVEPTGVVVFVHGDGPVDATSDGFYRPIWEDLARAGYASLSWSKPGVGGSTGDWLDQSLADRAAEVGAALDWVVEQPGVDPRRVGLWGASQGGWVVPAVAARRDDVAFAILVSPAVNWLRQGRYHLLASLDHEGASAADRERAIAASDDTRRLLDERADYARYREETIDPEPMTRARWGFVARNYRADATPDLVAMAGRDVPTLLLLADGDLNVDADETERVYRDLLGEDVRVRRFAGARHSLARAAVEDDAVLGLVTGVLAPRRVFVPGYTSAQREFLLGLEHGRPTASSSRTPGLGSAP